MKCLTPPKLYCTRSASIYLEKEKGSPRAKGEALQMTECDFEMTRLCISEDNPTRRARRSALLPSIALCDSKRRKAKGGLRGSGIGSTRGMAQTLSMIHWNRDMRLARRVSHRGTSGFTRMEATVRDEVSDRTG